MDFSFSQYHPPGVIFSSRFAFRNEKSEIPPVLTGSLNGLSVCVCVCVQGCGCVPGESIFRGYVSLGGNCPTSNWLVVIVQGVIVQEPSLPPHPHTQTHAE